LGIKVPDPALNHSGHCVCGIMSAAFTPYCRREASISDIEAVWVEKWASAAGKSFLDSRAIWTILKAFPRKIFGFIAPVASPFSHSSQSTYDHD